MTAYTTPAGTHFTSYEFTSSAGETAQYVVPDAKVGASKIPLVLSLHGSGGDYKANTESEMIGVRNWLMDNGCAYVEAGGGLGWGGPSAVAAYRAAYDHALEHLDVGKVAILGRSMGALVGVSLYLNEPVISARAEGLLLVSGTADLKYRYDSANGTDKPNILAAYGATNDASLYAAITNYDPMQIAASKWAGKKVLHVVSNADTTVVAGRHTLPLRRRVQGGSPARNGIHIVNGNGNGGASNAHNATWTDTGAITACTDFLSDVLGMTSREVLTIRTSIALS